MRLVAMDMDVDFSTHAGLIIWANLSAIAEMESERIGERVADVAEAHAGSGRCTAGGGRSTATAGCRGSAGSSRTLSTG